MVNKIRKEWFSNSRADVLAGIVVALALIPEAIGFSIIAGVDPMIGLYASFCIAVVISFVGGRPGMISAATGAMALVLAGLVKKHGIEYMLAATILTGIIQLILGFLGIGKLVKFIPKSVMTGFVNSLAILIFMAQLPYFVGQSWQMYAMVIGGLIIIYTFPRLTKVIPAPLVAIIVISMIAIFTGSDVNKVGDMGNISGSLPSFILPNVPFNFETLQIIFPYAVSLALVGLIESLLTAQLLDDLTDTTSNKNKESKGQGIANIVNGLFGGMAGCAMIGQSVINVKSGGRSRLSTFVAGSFLMFLIIVLNKLVVQIPLAALVSVMFMVSISTFDWTSIKTLHKLPKTDAIVLVVTVVAVVSTHNLAIGVIIGIVLSAVFFAFKISKVKVTSQIDLNKRVYKVEGQLFFASVTDFVAAFNFKEQVKIVDVDLSKAHIWDESGVAAIDKLVIKFHENNIKTNIIGLNAASKSIVDSIAVFNKPNGINQNMGHQERVSS
ncbi:SulP family inorganic anion transporter [Bacillus sp. AFS041924]|uniref:SulP family inorganic anion transporter n=1 Tax=Bacillus sp. AFS041924 TaxID=2033503 RepID=UPI000BFB918C|nr:SulP family inorganic anion transporter [Bacillus sp. AFS041924]PGS49379.1 sodium-independent anion transporter [Bacillus sp. AFS041924]